VDSIQHGPDIEEVTDQVGSDDVVEGLGVLDGFGIVHPELEPRVFAGGDLDHPRTDIDAQGARRLEVGQQVSRSASEFQHRLRGRDQQPQAGLQERIVGAVARVPLVAERRQPVVIRPDILLEFRQVREGGRCQPGRWQVW
jgi:hypothetical protein